MNPTANQSEAALIALGDPEARGVAPGVLEAHGGFAWWYLDTIDENGDGAVIIWSYGLPFLPGYLSAARKGRGEPARDRPSLNIAIYRGGERAFYLLQEYGRGGASMDEQGNFRFGSTRIDRVGDGQVRLRFDTAVPRSRDRLRGELLVEGPPAVLAEGQQPSEGLEHRWCPVLGPSHVRGELTVGSERFGFDAPAYHDRNEGTQRFDDLGIDHWSWGRLVHPERTAVWYLCYAKVGPPVAWGAEFLSDGTARIVDGLEASLDGPRKGPFGMTTWAQVTLTSSNGETWLRAQVGNRVDDGPFYARTVVDVEAGDRSGPGLAEWIVPDRIDLDRHRPLVRMAVHDLRGRNSFWLPLFSGPRQGRVARLLGLGARPVTSAEGP